MKRHTWILFGTVAGVALMAHEALAETVVLPEVLVTARKRAESYQEVPIAITAFTQLEIEKAGIEKPIDFIALTPNVTLTNTQNVGSSFISIRGISQARNSEPSVAIVVDGVLMSNPVAFNTEMFDIASIQVLKGPQGALYGRNAIGGAIIVDTLAPTDEFETRLKVGVDSGPGVKAQTTVSGPISDTLKFRASGSYVDTAGYIPNTYLGKDADPYRDISGRLRLVWDPNDSWTVDLRGSIDRTDTQALWYNIVVPDDVNNVSLPVRVNNPGVNPRRIYDTSAKIDYKADFATITSITAYNKTTELYTGDAYDFLPNDESLFVLLGGHDISQSIYFTYKSVSQELRLTSPDDQRLRWVAGGYMISTDRVSILGNQIDLPNVDGVVPIKSLADLSKTSTVPYGIFDVIPPGIPHPQNNFIMDGQNNFAWSFFGDLSYDVAEGLEAEISLRYDKDHRKNTTLTPTAFLPVIPGFPQPHTGDVRSANFTAWQPKGTLRYSPNDNLTVYASYGRGFRSGGFNQTGVGELAAFAGIAGVTTVYKAETAWTGEVGVKARLLDGRANVGADVYHTIAKGSPFFYYLFQNATQNIGNIDKVRHVGFELTGAILLTEGLQASVGLGYNDSKILKFPDPVVLGNQAPLVTRFNGNATLQYRHSLTGNVDWSARLDYEYIGRTWWDPYNITSRNPVNLFNFRGGIEGKTWSLMGWVKNLTNKKYNAESSPNGYLFKALPRRWGVDFVKQF